MEFINQIKSKYKQGDLSLKLIFICAGLFVLSTLVNFLFFAYHPLKLQDYFGVLGNFEMFLRQAWGIFTYMFFHANLIHLLFNCLMLYVMGKFFLRYFRDQDLWTFFFFGGISGGILFLIYSNLATSSNWSLVGASASVYAIFFALVAYVPKMNVQFAIININLPLDKVALILLGFDLIMIVMNNNVGGHISHFGGAAFGYLYMKQFEKGNDFLGKFFRNFFQKKSKLRTTKNSTPKPPKDDYEFNAQKVEKQKRIDQILDKISRSGYDSLSKEEKDFLFKSGRNG